MTIIQRVSNIVKSNINSILDKAENPIKNLELIVTDMRKQIQEARKKVADAIAQEKYLEKEAQSLEQSIDEWTQRAESALKKDRDDLARDALKEKAKAKQKLDLIRPQHKTYKEESERLKDELREMEAHYEDVVSKKETLIAKARVAEARTATSYSQPSSLIDEETHQALKDAEDKIHHMEARAIADKELSKEMISPHQQFAELEREEKERNIEEELEKMKQKLR